MTSVSSPHPPSTGKAFSRAFSTPPSTSRRTTSRIIASPYSISSQHDDPLPCTPKDIQQIIHRQKEANAERKRITSLKMHSPMKEYLDQIRLELLERIEYEVMQSEDPKSREMIASSFNTSPTSIFSSTPPRTMLTPSRSTPSAPNSIQTSKGNQISPTSDAPLPSKFPTIQSTDCDLEKSQNENEFGQESSLCTKILCFVTLTVLCLLISPSSHEFFRNRGNYSLLITPLPALTNSSAPRHYYPTPEPRMTSQLHVGTMRRDPTLTYEYYSKLNTNTQFPVVRRKRRLSDVITAPFRLLKRLLNFVLGFHHSLDS